LGCSSQSGELIFFQICEVGGLAIDRSINLSLSLSLSLARWQDDSDNFGYSSKRKVENNLGFLLLFGHMLLLCQNVTTSEFLLTCNDTTWAHFFNSFASFALPLVLWPGEKF
jgi:hypothetical protein